MIGVKKTSDPLPPMEREEDNYSVVSQSPARGQIKSTRKVENSCRIFC